MINKHKQLVDDILIEFGSRHNIRLWQHPTGMARALDGKAIIRYGLEGSSDIIGLTSEGVFIAIEVKTGTGRLSKTQENFKAMIEKFNGIYVEARCLDDVAKQLPF